MHRCHWLKRWMGWALFFVLIAGCTSTGPKPDIVSDEKSPDRTYSNAEVRRMTVDQPHLMSGDYFRKRTEQDMQATELEDILPASGGKEGQSGNSPEKDRIRRDGQNETTISPGLTGRDAYTPQIGFFLSERELPGNSVEQLIQAADRAADDNMRLINDTGMQEVIASTDCPAAGDFACIAENAALYPGVRMLVIVKGMHLPDEFPGEGGIRFTVMDAAIGYSYPDIEIADRIQEAPLTDEFFKDAMIRVFDYARRKAQVMPEHCRVFSVKNDRAYINAGNAAGLKKGAVFTFVSGGEILRSPNGVPVAWVPDDAKGTLQVERLVGADLAGCRLIDGEMPGEGAYVLLDDF